MPACLGRPHQSDNVLYWIFVTDTLRAMPARTCQPFLTAARPIEMKQRQLTTDGTKVSVIGLGTWPLGGAMGDMDLKTAIAVTRTAIDGGINLIDTAQAYLKSEERLGKALKDGYRDRCFLATKVIDDYSPKGIQRAMDDSLRKLDVDHVDLYQVHHPDLSYPFDQTFEAMGRLREQGKTRYIGVSNYKVEHLEAALRTSALDTNQPRYSMLDRRVENDVLPFCQQHGIGILTHSPLAKGLLTGRYKAGHQFAENDERASLPRFRGERCSHYLRVADELQDIARNKGIGLVQLAIAWIMRLAPVSCVLVGAKNPEQVHDHLRAAEVVLTDEELDRIEIILQNTPGHWYDEP